MKKILLSIIQIAIASCSFAQWSTSGSKVYVTDTTQYVGIGTANSVSLLTIQADNAGIYDTGQLFIRGAANRNKVLSLGFSTSNNVGFIQALIAGDNYYPLILNPHGGNVGIGTTNLGSYKLAVNGGIHSQSVNVDLTGWSDYVFKKEYQLPSLTEVKTYIDQNHHLPDIPSEQEVIKDGINLGEMNKLLTKKVEELTLYLIEEHKSNQKLSRSVTALNKKIQKLSKNTNK